MLKYYSQCLLCHQIHRNFDDINERMIKCNICHETMSKVYFLGNRKMIKEMLNEDDI